MNIFKNSILFILLAVSGLSQGMFRRAASCSVLPAATYLSMQKSNFDKQSSKQIGSSSSTGQESNEQSYEKNYSGKDSFWKNGFKAAALVGATASIGLGYPLNNKHNEESERLEHQKEINRRNDLHACEDIKVLSLFEECKQALGMKDYTIGLFEDLDYGAAAYYCEGNIYITSLFLRKDITQQRFVLLHELRHYQQYKIFTDQDTAAMIEKYEKERGCLNFGPLCINRKRAAEEYDADRCAAAHTKSWKCLVSAADNASTLNWFAYPTSYKKGYMRSYEYVPLINSNNFLCNFHKNREDLTDIKKRYDNIGEFIVSSVE